jgi:RNA polymerase sigma factor (sigma-70 family)
LKFVRHPSSKTGHDEQTLLAEYRATGDLEILGKLYEPYMPLLYGLCLNYFKDEDESKDAVMQIFEQLITKLKIHEVSNFKSWLYTLARNYCLMALRTSGKHQTVSLDVNVENDAFVHPDIDESHEHQLKLMEKCMKKLPEDQAACVRLFYLDQKCYKEVAEITGNDINKVKSYIQNGKRNLKICMEKNGRE